MQAAAKLKKSFPFLAVHETGILDDVECVWLHTAALFGRLYVLLPK